MYVMHFEMLIYENIMRGKFPDKVSLVTEHVLVHIESLKKTFAFLLSFKTPSLPWFF